MKYTEICEGIKLSSIGIGGWQLGLHGWGDTNIKSLETAILSAVDAGVNWIDSAPIYGLGDAEINAGKIIKQIPRDKIVVATKFGMQWGKKDGKFSVVKNSKPERIQEELHDSLKRLDVDYIDIYQVHWPDETTPMLDVVEELEKHLKSGKIRAYGVSNFMADNLNEIADLEGNFATNQLCYNYIDRDVEQEALPKSLDMGMSIVTHTSLAKGALAGHFKKASEFPAEDHRSRDKYFSDENYEANKAKIDKFNAVAAELGVKPSQLAVKWLLDGGQVASVICGFKDDLQLKQNLDAISIKENVRDLLE